MVLEWRCGQNGSYIHGEISSGFFVERTPDCIRQAQVPHFDALPQSTVSLPVEKRIQGSQKLLASGKVNPHRCYSSIVNSLLGVALFIAL
jgi:hypothetical protein